MGEYGNMMTDQMVTSFVTKIYMAINSYSKVHKQRSYSVHKICQTK
jgi:hypothetical protein